MSVWLTPQLKPFFGGTYFSPKDSFYRPGFASILRNVAKQVKQDYSTFACPPASKLSLYVLRLALDFFLLILISWLFVSHSACMFSGTLSVSYELSSFHLHVHL